MHGPLKVKIGSVEFSFGHVQVKYLVCPKSKCTDFPMYELAT